MNKISQYRKKLGLTQSDLAKNLGCSKSSLGHYETGRRKVDLDVCRQLVSFFNENGINVTIDDVFPPKAA
ncbi:helix-turn-helix transcriptional regulator [Providencia stuartii]|uniref:helix-turn-helix transcriptional regulator n=1 Tax=Providencia TaxID=586 RepID=UPI0018C9954B|nr:MULTISPECIES: helix-turn-helix transcriptional regulator [Providencia]MDN7223186.1 helix-turn-helix transcriptional regulator [Providencia stuartii]QPN39488.1 helix-turn-helix transcriptional regulator [Providencia sp. 2.29]WAZ79828.1 helix-turn-helix transcriptional regulator [Providencia stuartii]WAZ82947.1 helix-turn-helix transcriptional regulator [Providencia stuartii]